MNVILWMRRRRPDPRVRCRNTAALAKPALEAADLRFAQVERVYSGRGSLQVHSGDAHSRVAPDLAVRFQRLRVRCGVRGEQPRDGLG